MTQALPIIQFTTVDDFAANVAHSSETHVSLYDELLVQTVTISNQLSLQTERPISSFTALVTTPGGQQAIATLTVVQGKPRQTVNGRPFPDEDAGDTEQLVAQQRRHVELREAVIEQIHAIDPLLTIKTYSGAVYTPPDMNRLIADWSPAVEPAQ